jgi:hypothetical protein
MRPAVIVAAAAAVVLAVYLWKKRAGARDKFAVSAPASERAYEAAAEVRKALAALEQAARAADCPEATHEALGFVRDWGAPPPTQVGFLAFHRDLMLRDPELRRAAADFRAAAAGRGPHSACAANKQALLQLAARIESLRKTVSSLGLALDCE